MPSNGNRETSAKRHNQNIVDNPHIADWFFHKRFEIFFNDVLKKQWDLEDWWFRFEWQHRGSVHVHGIGKRKNAPTIEWKHMKEDENKMNEIIQYLDSLDMPVPERHPCQKKSNELNDDQQDYIDLINKLQRHTRCSPATFVRDDNNGQPKLVTRRNDQYINSHSRLQLQGWWANVDLKPILSIHAALQYVAKYASKAEPRSSAFSDVLNRILSESQPEDALLTPAQKLLLHSIAERDISAQETCHILLGLPLYHSSRQFVFLNLNKEAPRWIRGTGESEESYSVNNDSGRTEKSPLKIYWDRPTELEDFTLFRLHLIYKLVKGRWKECQQENVVRVFSRPLSLREDLTEDRTIAWSSLYNDYIEEINADLIDLLGSPIDDEESEINDEEELFEEDDDEQDEHRPDWMFLAEMGPKPNFDCSSDLGLRDIDRNHDWINDLRERYTD
ncbi:unnamed protein product [Rhizophagus irregularis]|nr:unnamed protein product [Rhizophagus irregularis]